MGLFGRFWSLLWSEGYGQVEQILGLLLFVDMALFPWIVGWNGSMTLLYLYLQLDKTIYTLNIMLCDGLVHAVVALITVLIILPFAVILALLNAPVLSGILSITSGTLLILTYKVKAYALEILMLYGWAIGEPYSLSIGTYGLIVIGVLLLISYWHHRKTE